MPQNLLLEIGTEEIPARFMQSALIQLQALAEETFSKERIDFREVKVYGTPRRLALCVKDLAAQQNEKAEEVKGPSKKAAFDAEGQPTKAALGFARSQGVAVGDLQLRETAAGEYLFARKRIVGRPTREVLPELLPGFITGLNFPKPMRWGYGELRFARPIHWLLALYGSEIIPFTIEGLQSDRVTYGHRFLSPGKIVLEKTHEYRERLKENYVLVDQEERKKVIWRQIEELAEKEGGQVAFDRDLLDEVTYLLEYPTALCGRFAEKYLDLPEEVLITPMREHQRYFPVRDFSGRLLPKFITVRNGIENHLAIVREGNEKVLHARLADARFFFEEDLKTPLEQNLEKLKRVVFQESLGMMFDKVQRIRALSAFMAQGLAWPEEKKQDLDRAAMLAKADLVTNMVYEFPELQGRMGTEYASRKGEKKEVALAISEHYLPRHAGDQLPVTDLGVLVSLADKMDTLIGCFAVGIQPTGSQDPYTLRRQAIGVCRIILTQGLEFSLHALIEGAYRLYATSEQVRLKLTLTQVQAEIKEFFQLRLRNLLSEKGISYDVQEAVLAVGFDNLPDLYQRALEVQAFRQRSEFADLITVYTRAYNLARQAERQVLDPAIFLDPAETQLFTTLQRAQTEVEAALRHKEIARALESLATLREPIAEFFTQVMVMVDDPKIRNNRLALLAQVAELATRIADFSRMVIE